MYIFLALKSSGDQVTKWFEWSHWWVRSPTFLSKTRIDTFISLLNT